MRPSFATAPPSISCAWPRLRVQGPRAPRAADDALQVRERGAPEELRVADRRGEPFHDARACRRSGLTTAADCSPRPASRARRA